MEFFLCPVLGRVLGAEGGGWGSRWLSGVAVVSVLISFSVLGPGSSRLDPQALMALWVSLCAPLL